MPELVALDLPGGPAFVDELQRAWDAGDTVFPLDQRLPMTVRADVVAAMGVTAVVDHAGERTAIDGGRPTEPGDAIVVATSGSSGRPKGVVLTHEAVAASADATSRRLGVRRDDHWLACLPLSHVGGLTVVTRALRAETKLTVHPGFDAAAVDASEATLVSLVATALRRIDATRFRTIVLGGSRPPADRPPNTVTTYGMTETGSGVVYDRVPLEGVELRIVDGEIQVRGPMLLRCYRDDTNPVRPDGWFPTGDLGEIGPDGLLTVHGRRGDLIITGGENVWPEPVEAVLRTVDGVADAAVVGRPDPEWGEVVTALVVPTTADTPVDLATVRAAVREHLPAYCAPRRVVYVEGLPRSTLGKLSRAELADLAD